MTDRIDWLILLALDGDQTCGCCGRVGVPTGDVDVVDGEVTCLDCVATYHPEVYARRTGGDPDAP